MKHYLTIAGFFAGTAVILGAFELMLERKLNISSLQVFETAVRYQFYHVFALLVWDYLQINQCAGTQLFGLVFYVRNLVILRLIVSTKHY